MLIVGDVTGCNAGRATQPPARGDSRPPEYVHARRGVLRRWVGWPDAPERCCGLHALIRSDHGEVLQRTSSTPAGV